MRIVPLLPSSCAPEPWLPFEAVELAWTGGLHPGWTRAAGSPPVHALHLPRQAWGPGLGESALAVLGLGLEADFLVLRATVPGDRTETSAFMGVLEGLLEVTQGGPKLALRPGPGAAPGLGSLLRAARGAAVGFCWDAAVAGDLDSIEDRLYCAVGAEGDDFGPLQALGYRWNMAIPAQDPAAHRALAARITLAFPPVLFPAPRPPVPEELP
jgi:hypothetical protein